MVQHLTGDDTLGVVDAVTAFLVARGWSVECTPIPGDTNGYTATDGTRRVVIDADLAPAQAAKTALHEAAHALLHADLTGAEYAQNRGVCETEAESFAYVVAGLLGLDTSAYSIGYVAGWSDADTDLIRSTATNVLRAVHTIADALTADALTADHIVPAPAAACAPGPGGGRSPGPPIGRRAAPGASSAGTARPGPPALDPGDDRPAAGRPSRNRIPTGAQQAAARARRHSVGRKVSGPGTSTRCSGTSSSYTARASSTSSGCTPSSTTRDVSTTSVRVRESSPRSLRRTQAWSPAGAAPARALWPAPGAEHLLVDDEQLVHSPRLVGV